MAEPSNATPLATGAAADTWSWERIALWLVTGTLAYNVAEAAIALWFGREADSVALVGFGFDSLIETAAASVLLWRLWVEASGADSTRVKAIEHRVHRFVGATFLVLAAYIVLQSAWTLWNRNAPAESPVGIVLAAASLVIMPLVAWAKLRAADEIGSAALRAEAKETIACSYLSFTLLLGLGANAAVGWWWADPVAAVVMVPWLVMEGREGLSGNEDCCG